MSGPRRQRRARGGATPSSTRSTSAASPTPTATGSATSPASPRACATCATSASTPSGSRRSTPRRSTTPGTTWPTTATSTRASARWPTSTTCSRRPTSSGSRSSSTWCPTTRRPSTRGSRRRWRADPGSPERARYLFRRGKGRGGAQPPNNWESVFGGPAWTRVPDLTGSGRRRVVPPPLRHLPARPRLAQPRGAGDVRGRAALLARPRRRRVPGRRRPRPVQGEEPARPARHTSRAGPTCPSTASAPARPRSAPRSTSRCGTSPRCTTSTAPGTASSRRTTATGWPSPRPGPRPRSRWRATCDPTSSTRPSTSPGCWRRGRPRRSPTSSAAPSPPSRPVGAVPTWVLSNHDVVRHPTRYGGGPRGLARARAATLTMLALPGSAYLYQGEELGLEEVDVPPESRQDPVWFRTGNAGRDGARVPIPWRGTRPPYGFGPAGTQTWLPMPDDWAPLTVAAQRKDPASTWSFYRDALRARRRFARRRRRGGAGRHPLDGARGTARSAHRRLQLRLPAGAPAGRRRRPQQRPARRRPAAARHRGLARLIAVGGIVPDVAVMSASTTRAIPCDDRSLGRRSRLELRGPRVGASQSRVAL